LNVRDAAKTMRELTQKKSTGITGIACKRDASSRSSPQTQVDAAVHRRQVGEEGSARRYGNNSENVRLGRKNMREKEPSEKSAREWGYSRPENGAGMFACCEAQQTEKKCNKIQAHFYQKMCFYPKSIM
jgi:hypothetical protein